MSAKLRVRASFVALLLALGFGCDGESPSAPTDAPIVVANLFVSGTPESVETGQTSIVSVIAILSDGNAARGATVVVATNFGSLDGDSTVTLTLNDEGAASATFFAPDEAGVATLTAQINTTTASGTIEVTQDEGQVAVAPDVELTHSRSSSECEDPISPVISVSNLGKDVIDYVIVNQFPDWLRVDEPTGQVPGSFQAIFTCNVGDGDLDLTHRIRVQGVDRSTGDALGNSDTVTVTVRVRG